MFARIIFMLMPKKREKYIEKMQITKFKDMYKRVYFGLLVNGMIPKRLNVGIILIWVINFVIQLLGITILGNTMYLDILKGDYSDATRQMNILVLLVMMLLKLSCLIRQRKVLDSLLTTLDEDYYNASKDLSQSDMVVVKTYAMWGVWLQDLWCVLVIGSGTIFWWGAFILMFYSLVIDDFTKQMMFDCVLPLWDDMKYVSPFYEMVFIYEMAISVFAMALYISFDLIVPIFLMHVCAQLEVVKKHLATLFDDERKNDEVKIQKELCWIVEKLQRIYSFAIDINRMSTSAYETIFFFTPILSTSSAFQILSCLKNGEIPYEFTIFLITTGVHIFIPSYFGNMMIEKSLSICDAVYNCSWESNPSRSVSSTLLIIMIRAQRPLQLYTMFKPISLMLFSEASQRTWTYFNLMLASFK